MRSGNRPALPRRIARAAVAGMVRRLGWALVAGGLVVPGLLGCARPEKPLAEAPPSAPAEPPKQLSAFSLFVGDPVEQVPAEGVIPYELNSPLFTDYALKFRFVKLPPGTKAKYDEKDVFNFPVGTVIAKTFAYPADMREPKKNVRLIETRVLWHREDGWVGLPYLWNADQKDATLKVAGRLLDMSWVHYDGQEIKTGYLVPNANQCKGCHTESGPALAPIGPKARHLNRDQAYPDGTTENQLVHWAKAGVLEGAPADCEQAPRLPKWDVAETGSIEQRARAYLDINCAHCHNRQGPAKASGLYLSIFETEPSVLGVMKTPVAAGRGSGDMKFDVVPGHPDASIMLYRMQSTHAGIMMPELGKRLVHQEGVALIREWVEQMAPKSAAVAR
ncbi:MAG: hypothetical protein K1X74_03190 [Pirellulales bacterium]|nr:hypothetical protein [Pirellulales bacterium]